MCRPSAASRFGDVSAARFALKAPHRVVLDFAQPRDRVGSRRWSTAVSRRRTSSTATSSSPRSRRGPEPTTIDDRVRQRRRGAQSERRVSLHAVRAGAGAAGVSVLRPAGPEGAVHARRSTVPGGWQAVANGARSKRRTRSTGRPHDASVSPRRSRCRRICSRSSPGKFSVETATRDGRPFRMFHRETDAAKVARNRDAHLRPARPRARVARGLHRDPVSVRQVRLRPDPVVPVQRHGARRARFSTTQASHAARRVRHAEPAARSRQHDRARDRAHVVRRSRDDAAGSTMCG